MDINYRKICTNLLKDFSPRTSNIIERRFGLKTLKESKLSTGQAGKRETLEAIGQDYGITRERVRQIENEGLSVIKNKIKNYPQVLKEFNKAFDSLGGFKREDLLLSHLGRGEYQNEAFFLLNLYQDFFKVPENDKFYSFWSKKDKNTNIINKVINIAIKELKKRGTTFKLDKLFRSLKGKLSNGELGKNVFNSCLEISKNIEQSPEGEYGLIDWVEINPKGVKDKAYLVLKKEEKPLHFTNIASMIEKLPFSDSKVHTATVHNELIKDPRFVLVGRGLYALKEWGYEPGVVKDIIFKVLKNSNKPLSKDEVLEKVIKQRFVKENTVFLNLHDRNSFRRDSQGRYTVNPFRDSRNREA